jgi:hypothetical protein
MPMKFGVVRLAGLSTDPFLMTFLYQIDIYERIGYILENHYLQFLRDTDF